MSLRRLSRLTLAGVWDIVKHPTLIPVRLSLAAHARIPEIIEYVYPGTKREEIEKYRKEFLLHNTFFADVNNRYVVKRGKRARFEGWPELLYILVRIARPGRVVETGIFDGHSSAVILRALEDNKSGELVSIDLPAYGEIEHSTDRMKDTALPPGEKPGWMIPDYLRARHRLILGDAKEHLPKVLEELQSIDIFLHDSLHTFRHQWFEYSTAWPYLARDGLLLSDDVFWNTAYNKFLKRKHISYRVYHGLGIAKKVN